MTNATPGTSDNNQGRLVALDLFAGSGWGVACQRLGIEEHGVEIMPEAVATRTAAGMSTVFHDVWDGLEDRRSPEAERGLEVWLKAGGTAAGYRRLLIASPPCQTFSNAGKGVGRKALDDVLGLIRSEAFKLGGTGLRDAAAALSLDDRTALVLTPLAYAWRHVPAYIALEQVPAVLPVWEAVAEVLRTELGYSVVTGVLNAEQYGVPQTRRRAILLARRDGLTAAMPAPTHSRYYSREPARLDEGVLPWVSMAHALGWGMTERPYPTVATGTEAGGTDPAALGGSGARRTVYGERERGAWAPSNDPDNDSGILRLNEVEAGMIQTYPPFGLRPEVASWKWVNAPATTVAGDPRITSREHHSHGEQNSTSLRLEASEAVTLQTFPDRFPFQGTKTKRFLQIGNAVPPLLAERLLDTFM